MTILLIHETWVYFLSLIRGSQSGNIVSALFLDGKFGAFMQVHIQNDGPVTIELTSPTGHKDPRLVRYRTVPWPYIIGWCFLRPFSQL